MSIFIKSFFIGAVSAAVVVIAGLLGINALLTPPQQVGVVAADANRHEVDEEGFLIVNYNDNGNENEEDDCPWPVYNAPHWAADAGRREYFWTFLIVGLNEGTNANTVMVASYCGITRRAELVSIPRDVPVHPTRNGRKIASSYIIGAARGGGVAGGIGRLQSDVKTVIGFVPDYYVLIDYDTFFTIIDAVGGIYIDVPIRMRYDDPCQNLYIDLHPGLQHMDGETALLFSRFRQANRGSGFPDMPGGDLGRIQNQQAVISAVISQLLRFENLNPIRINEFVGIFNDSVHTNIPLRDVPFFATELRHISGLDALTVHTFPTQAAMRNGVSYQILTPSYVVEIINATINPFNDDFTVDCLQIVR